MQLMKPLFITFQKEQTKRQNQLKVVAFIVGLFFFNFSVLNSANCRTFCHTTLKAALEDSSVIVLSAEMAKQLKTDPHYLCKLYHPARQHADSSDPADGNSSHECDFCYYCLMMLSGMAVTFTYFSPVLHSQPEDNNHFSFDQSIPVQPFKYAKSSRAPPLVYQVLV
jgi:hypothetical protein